MTNTESCGALTSTSGCQSMWPTDAASNTVSWSYVTNYIPLVQIRKVINGFVATIYGSDYVFESMPKLLKFIEKELSK